MSLYAVALASLIATDVIGALRVVLIGATVLAGWTFFVAAREGRWQLGAALAAALYVLAPYRLMDLYERFALAEFVSLPLVFLAVRRLVVQPTRGSWFLFVAAYGALILTHLPVAYQTLFLLAPYALVLSALAHRPWRLVPILAAIAVAVLCATIFLLPAIVERGDVHFESLLAPWFDWRVNFLFREKVVPGFGPDLTKQWAEAAAVRQGFVTLAAAALLAFGRHNGVSPRLREG